MYISAAPFFFIVGALAQKEPSRSVLMAYVSIIFLPGMHQDAFTLVFTSRMRSNAFRRLK